MPHDARIEPFADGLDRRTFLKRTGVAGAAVLGGTLWATAPAAARARRGQATTPLRHVIISCQENRSFDHYFGYAPWIGPYGPRPGWSQPDGQGGSVAPYRFTSLTTPDVPHLRGRERRADRPAGAASRQPRRHRRPVRVLRVLSR